MPVSLFAVAAVSGTAVAVEGDNAPSSLEEVVVTATKRAENILSVPISMSAVSQAQLEQEGVKDINDFSRLVPGISLVPAGPTSTNAAQSTGSRTVVIRGIAATAGSATTGIYLDDTPIQAREAGTIYPAVFDLERVEVLRGPQGTLFGAGSEGGTVRFITPTPSLTQFSAMSHGELAFTTYGAPSFEAGIAAGGPVIDDKVGVRASVWSRHDGGYIDRFNFFTNEPIASNTNSTDSYVGRVAVLAHPIDNLTITPAIYFQKINKDDSDVWWSTKGVYQSYYNLPQPTSELFYLPTLAVEYQLPYVSIKSITSYFSRAQHGINQFFHSSKQNLFYAQVPNYSLSDYIDRTQDNFTEELRLTSDSEHRLTWVAGMFLTDNRESYKEAEVEPLADELWLATTGFNINDFFGVPQIDGDISYRDRRVTREKEIAGFADASFKVTDRLKLNGGLRVSHTQFSFTEVSDGPFGVGGDLLPLATDGKSKESPVTPKGGISYDLDNGLAYANVAKGYRIGGANQLLPNICADQLKSLGVNGAAPPYTSDKVLSYEVGAKRRFADGNVLISGSVFRVDWSRIQGIIPLNSCAYSYTGNFGTAVSQGGDLQLLVQPFRGLEVGGTLAYTDAHYTETVPVPGDATQLLVKNGDPLLFTPKWAGSLNLGYNWSPVDGYNTYVRGDGTYSGSYERTYSEGVNGFIDSIRHGQSITEFSLVGGVKHDEWDAFLFIHNLTNNSTPQAEDVGTHPGTYGATAIRSISLRPRTIGVSLTWRH